MTEAAIIPSRPAVHTYRGYFYIAAAALAWGISATLGRAAFTARLPGAGFTKIDALILSQCRTSFSFLALLLILAPRRGIHGFRLPWKDMAQLFVLGIAGVAASNYFYYLAIQLTNVATAIVVQYTAPVWVLLYMVARGKERPTVAKMASVALALLGIVLVIDLFGHGGLRLNRRGVIAALIAAFSFSFYNIGGHSLLERLDRWTVLLYTTLSASLFWIFLNPPSRIAAAHYSPAAWIFLAGFSLLSVLLPFSFYFAGLQRLEPTRAVIVSCLEPVFSIAIAALALGEVMHPLQAVGVVMVLAAILIVHRPGSAATTASAGPVD